MTDMEQREKRIIAIVRNTWPLAFLALVIGLALALLHEVTERRIEANEAAQQRQQLARLLQLEDAALEGLTLPDRLPETFSLCVAVNGAQQRFAVGRGQVGGYAGSIEFITAIDQQSELRGVEILRHQETPGLGDKIETGKSDWLAQFQGRSAVGDAAPWRLRDDGGDVDGLSGATVTARALTRGLSDTAARLSGTDLTHCDFALSSDDAAHDH